MRAPCRAAIAGWMLCVAGIAPAHDSWLSPAGGPGMLELSTGRRYPVSDVGPPAASVLRSACRDHAGVAWDLEPARQEPRQLQLQVHGAASQPQACWAELHPAEIELAPSVVDIYFAEIHASAAQRAAWASLQARGLAWRESYRKFARIELASAADAGPARLLAARQPVGLDMEIVALGDRPFAAGEAAAFQVLRDGRPLAAFPVELVSERSALGVWRETDGQGVVRVRLPFGGRWLLRGTDLRLADEERGLWRSRFVTLAIEAR